MNAWVLIFIGFERNLISIRLNVMRWGFALERMNTNANNLGMPEKYQK